MNTLKVILLIALAFGALLVVLKVFSAPLKLAMKLALNTFFGFAALVIGSILPFSPGVNLINAIAVGLLGLPGWLMLVLVKWLFGT